MSLAIGTKLGPYEIVAPLGAGGMGEVYRAKDTNLDRDAAIKVLPESFALDASIRVNDQYRITFRYEAGHAWEVRCEDYHS